MRFVALALLLVFMGATLAPGAYYMTAEELRIDLKLTPEQQPVWDAFMRKLDAMRGDLMRERARVRRPSDLAAPQRIDQAFDLHA